jgi:hypothetical protein
VSSEKVNGARSRNARVVRVVAALLNPRIEAAR